MSDTSTTNSKDADLLYAALVLLRWVGRCSSIPGPAGTTAYIIKPEVMYAIREMTKGT